MFKKQKTNANTIGTISNPGITSQLKVKHWILMQLHRVVKKQVYFLQHPDPLILRTKSKSILKKIGLLGLFMLY